jgi:hypothetical protein
VTQSISRENRKHAEPKEARHLNWLGSVFWLGFSELVLVDFCCGREILLSGVLICLMREMLPISLCSEFKLFFESN